MTTFCQIIRLSCSLFRWAPAFLVATLTTRLLSLCSSFYTALLVAHAMAFTSQNNREVQNGTRDWVHAECQDLI
ncbi:hypothetical protein F4825DRAFT_319239 [Nemania diffusa]|nr:hypothetical protein F4825DRAFT_319239 [Nemania diffusa]